MPIRVSGRRVVRSLVVALVAADPPRVILAPPTAPAGPLVPVSFVGPRPAVEIPPVPIDRSPLNGFGGTGGRPH